MTKNRVVLLPGGVRGIGKHIAESLAAKGWSIALCYRTSREEAEDTLKSVYALGAEGIAEVCDVSDPQACEALVESVVKKWGRIDALICCAGPYHRIGIFKETLEGWHSMFDNNLHPIFYLSRLVAPIMKQQKWGRIINFSMASAEKIESKPMVTAHYISKIGVLALSRALVKPLGPYGITVNTISPGFIDSQSVPYDELKKMEKHIPLGYIGTPVDVLGGIHFFLSEDASYVSGTNLTVSGGWGI